MLAKQVYHAACRISYRVSDISLETITFYDIISSKEGAIMSENKLLDLSFEFAVAIRKTVSVFIPGTDAVFSYFSPY